MQPFWVRYFRQGNAGNVRDVHKQTRKHGHHVAQPFSDSLAKIRCVPMCLAAMNPGSQKHPEHCQPCRLRVLGSLKFESFISHHFGSVEIWNDQMSFQEARSNVMQCATSKASTSTISEVQWMHYCERVRKSDILQKKAHTLHIPSHQMIVIYCN